MSLMDNKGRIFGRFNILDLFIIAIIIVLGVGGFYKVKKVNPTNVIKPKPVELKIIVMEREKFGVDMIKKGDILKEYDTGIVLGEIKDIEVNPASTEVVTTDGEIKIAEIPDRYDLLITIDAKAMITENAIMSGNKELRIGNKLVLRTKTYALDSIVLEVNPKEE
jgi:hypothetical protein